MQLLGKIEELAEDARVPKALAELDDRGERFTNVVGHGKDAVESAVRGWLDQRS